MKITDGEREQVKEYNNSLIDIREIKLPLPKERMKKDQFDVAKFKEKTVQVSIGSGIKMEKTLPTICIWVK